MEYKDDDNSLALFMSRYNFKWIALSTLIIKLDGLGIEWSTAEIDR